MSTSSGSASSAPTADELLKNLLDSVTPTASSASGNGSAASKTTGTTTTTKTTAPQPAATTATPTPSSTGQSVTSTADTQSSSSKGGSGAGLSIGLGVGAVLLVAFVVLYFRQRKKRRYKAPGHDHDLGTPQLSIELPRPPPLDNGGGKPQDDDRVSVFTSVQYGGESVFNAAGEVSPGFHAGMRPAPSQHRASNNPQTGPASTTFRMDSGNSSAFNPSIVNPVPDSSKTNKLTRVVAGHVPALDNPRAAPVPTEGGGSLPRDTSASTSSLNSLHDSTCGDFFKHGDGLGERIRSKSRTKHPSMVLEEDEEPSSRSNQPVASKTTATAAAAPTPKTAYAAPMTPLTTPPPVPAPRRAPPPPPPAAAFVKPPPIATSNSQTYRPSTTESEIRFQRLSTMSSDSIGSMKRASTSSTESANPRAGSMIEINEIVGGEGSQRAKEIEI
ncbi:hypothetical protein Gpo141_00001894 [Globisporangium polare]